MGWFCSISETVIPNGKLNLTRKIKGMMTPICVPVTILISYSLTIPLAHHLFNRKQINYLFFYVAKALIL